MCPSLLRTLPHPTSLPPTLASDEIFQVGEVDIPRPRDGVIILASSPQRFSALAQPYAHPHSAAALTARTLRRAASRRGAGTPAFSAATGTQQVLRVVARGVAVVGAWP
jgi:hypothetical protein